MKLVDLPIWSRIAAAEIPTRASTPRGRLAAMLADLRRRRAQNPAHRGLGPARDRHGRKTECGPMAEAGVRLHRALDAAVRGEAIYLPRELEEAPHQAGYRLVPVADDDAQARAISTIGRCGQRSNYGPGGPVCFGPAHQARWETIRYAGRFAGRRGARLRQCYQAAAAVSPSGRSMILIIECVMRRRLIAPRGLRFEVDDLGLLVRRLADGVEYHPSAGECSNRRFWSRVRRALAEAWVLRAAAARAARAEARAAEIFARDLPSTRVTLDDSRRAGNCPEGTLRFAESRLGLARGEVLAGRWLIGAPAARVLAVAGGEFRGRALAACRAAWQRETMVAI